MAKDSSIQPACNACGAAAGSGKVPPFYRPTARWTRDAGKPFPDGRRQTRQDRNDGQVRRNRPPMGRRGEIPSARGANTVSDTRALLNRIAEFRKRLEAMPRLIPVDGPAARHRRPPRSQPPEPTEPASRTQAILEYSLRQLGGTTEATPPALTDRARRLLVEAQGLVTRLRALADDPLLAGPRRRRGRAGRPAGRPLPGDGGPDRGGRPVRADLPGVGGRAEPAVRGAGGDDRRRPPAVRPAGRGPGTAAGRGGPDRHPGPVPAGGGRGDRPARPGPGHGPGGRPCWRRRRAGRCGSCVPTRRRRRRTSAGPAYRCPGPVRRRPRAELCGGPGPRRPPRPGLAGPGPRGGAGRAAPRRRACCGSIRRC